MTGPRLTGGGGGGGGTGMMGRVVGIDFLEVVGIRLEVVLRFVVATFRCVVTTFFFVVVRFFDVVRRFVVVFFKGAPAFFFVVERFFDVVRRFEVVFFNAAPAFFLVVVFLFFAVVFLRTAFALSCRAWSLLALLSPSFVASAASFAFSKAVRPFVATFTFRALSALRAFSFRSEFLFSLPRARSCSLATERSTSTARSAFVRLCAAV